MGFAFYPQPFLGKQVPERIYFGHKFIGFICTPFVFEQARLFCFAVGFLSCHKHILVQTPIQSELLAVTILPMQLYRMTPIPDEVFDQYLRQLSLGELKVLLVIMRQTLGYRHNGQFKERDWISGKQLRQKTGCSNRTIAQAITSLTKRKLIRVQDRNGNELKNAKARAGKHRLYFCQIMRGSGACSYDLFTPTDEEMDARPVKKIHATTDTHTTDNTTTSKFVWKKYIRALHNSSYRPHNIIGYFFEKKGLNFSNKHQADLAVERHLEAAKKVQHFSDTQIIRTVSYLINAFPRFTVETIYKHLTT